MLNTCKLLGAGISNERIEQRGQELYEFIKSKLGNGQQAVTLTVPASNEEEGGVQPVNASTEKKIKKENDLINEAYYSK